ncbi:MAG: ATP-dependent DNA helicase [Thermodesulfobacteriota bacterium]
MNSRPDPIQEVLGPEGSLSRSLSGFEFRSSQVQMAGMIMRALDEQVPAVVEAGTGTGKTLAYLVPLVLNGKKTVISTATKTLQEQIFHKDIPLLSKAAGLDIDAMLMKGRKNYLCLHRFHQFFARPSRLKLEQREARKGLDRWLRRTEVADRAELDWMGDEDPLWDAISSTSEQCLGSDCLHWDDCYLNNLRRRAAQARFIIVNHHLFFADLMVKRSGFGEIIPRFQVALFDEAHSLEDIATAYLGMNVSTKQLFDLADELEAEQKRIKGKPAEIKGVLDLIRAGTQHLWEALAASGERGRLGQEALSGLRIGPGEELRQAFRSLVQKAPRPEEIPEGPVPALLRRAAELEERLSQIFTLDDPGWLTWYENRKKTLVLHASPLDISRSLKELLHQKVKSVIFTSATLSTGGNFRYVRERLGIEEGALEGIYPSHFDFRSHTLLYLPRDLPVPAAPGFAEKAAGRIEQLVEISAGRALVLFTSYNNLHIAHACLNGKLPFTLYRQGDAPRSALLDAFRTDTQSVLLATGSFWEGVDVPGEALSLLVIDKLPFDSPGDPLVAARIEAIRSRGGNPFMEYQLPSAIISLKQGLGRLIRNSTDRGLLAVLDTRLLTSRYGRFFLESLPDMPLTHDLADVQKFFG